MLLDKVKSEHPDLTQARKAYPQSWFTYPVGRSGFSISTAFVQGALFRVELTISTGDQGKNKAAFDALYQDREAIETEVKQSIVWERLDERQASRLYCCTNGSISDDPARLEELLDWAVDLVGTFHRVFRPRVQKV